MVGFDKAGNQYVVDRTMVIGDASIELFADDGLTTMTDIFFQEAPLSNMIIRADKTLML